MLAVVALVLFVYFGGSNVPKILRDKKEMLLGVVGGLVLCGAYGQFGIEGMENIRNKQPCLNDTECKSGYCRIDTGSGGRTCQPETRPQKEINAQANRMDDVHSEMCGLGAVKSLMCGDASASLIWNEQCPGNTCP